MVERQEHEVIVRRDPDQARAHEWTGREIERPFRLGTRDPTEPRVALCGGERRDVFAR